MSRKTAAQPEEKVLAFRAYGWFCSKCNAIYLDPDADTEHEDWHESVEVNARYPDAEKDVSGIRVEPQRCTLCGSILKITQSRDVTGMTYTLTRCEECGYADDEPHRGGA